MPGQQSKRSLWGDALRLATAVAFVIDSTDERRLPLVAHELRRLMPRLCKQHVPVLFLATKQDCQGARSVAQVMAAADLAAACAALPAPWALRGCSACDYLDLCSSFRWGVRAALMPGRAGGWGSCAACSPVPCARALGSSRGAPPALAARRQLPAGLRELAAAAALLQVAAGPRQGAGGAARGEGGDGGCRVPKSKHGVCRQGGRGG
jgi:hypothetical protein